MPAARQRSSSPFMALAVTATIGRAGAAAFGFGGAQLPRQLMAVHARHVDVGKHGGVARHGCPGRQRLDAVVRGVGGDAQELELAHQHLAVHRMVVGDQHARAASPRRAPTVA